MNQVENRIDHHRARIFWTIATIHFLLSVVVFFLNGAVSMSRFDGGGPSDLIALLVEIAIEILSFPLLMGLLLMKIANTGLWGWLGFLGNSVLWGWVGLRVIRFWRSRHGGALENSEGEL